MAIHLGTGLAPDVAKALTDLRNSLDRYLPLRVKGTDPIHADLWLLGAPLAQDAG